MKQTAEEILINISCSLRNVSKKSLLSSTRKREVVKSRHECMYIIDKYKIMNKNNNGILFNRDRTSVYHAIKAINNLLETDKYYKSQFEFICNEFEKKSNIFSNKKYIKKNINDKLILLYTRFINKLMRCKFYQNKTSKIKIH